ncbi:transmembrane protein, putative [Medicago truncatula]|uniref:Transmembrane protein, putative n=1 Tax=Medicago truncatula TaxID=3880 RepID=A0A072UVL1_MEDTR|nr:transmembrane protein, putative [Medicago truncatula]
MEVGANCDTFVKLGRERDRKIIRWLSLFCECQCDCSIEMRKQRKVVDFFAAIWSGFFGDVYSSWRFISHDCSYSLIVV